MSEEGQKGTGGKKDGETWRRWGGQTVREYIGERKRAKEEGGRRQREREMEENGEE